MSNIEDSPPLTIHDPRRGTKLKYRFGIRKSKTLHFDQHPWVVLDGTVAFQRIGSLIASVARSIFQAHPDHVLILQIGPPLYREDALWQFPSSWNLLLDRYKSLVLRVHREALGDFESYFQVASSYEQWMLFFVPGDKLAELDFTPEFLSMNTFLNPPVPWTELIQTEGDFGSVLICLPFALETDRIVESLANEGIAQWESDSST